MILSGLTKWFGTRTNDRKVDHEPKPIYQDKAGSEDVEEIRKGRLHSAVNARKREIVGRKRKFSQTTLVGLIDDGVGRAMGGSLNSSAMKGDSERRY